MRDFSKANQDLKKYKDAATHHAQILAEEQNKAKEAEQNFDTTDDQLEKLDDDLKKALDDQPKIYDAGYNKGYNEAEADFRCELSSILSKVWTKSQWTYLAKAGVGQESPLWTEEGPVVAEHVQFITVVDLEGGTEQHLNQNEEQILEQTEEQLRDEALLNEEDTDLGSRGTDSGVIGGSNNNVVPEPPASETLTIDILNEDG